MDSELTQSLRRGAWTVAACHLASQLFSVIFLAVLYRLLPPTDFGLFAVVLVIVNFTRIFSTWGLGVASLQDQSLTDYEQSALLYFGMQRATLACGITLLAALIIGFFYGDSRLTGLLFLMLLGLVLSSTSLQHQARLERTLALGRLAVCRLTAQIIGGCGAIWLAWNGAGVWALGVQFCLETTSFVLLLWTAEPWRPIRLKKVQIDIERFKAFGFRYTASSVMFWILQNADTVLVGLLGGKLTVGFYSQAFNMMSKPVLLVTTPLTSVMLPTLARTAGQPELYRQLLVSYFRFVGQVLFPCSVGLFLVADDLMLVLGGEEWRPAGTLLRALAPIVAVQGFINIAGSVFASAGKAGRLFISSAAITLVTCLGLLVGWFLGSKWISHPLGGTVGLAMGYSFVTVLVVFVPYLSFCLKTVKTDLLVVLRELRKPLLSSIFMGVVVWAIQSQLPAVLPWIRLLICAAAGVFCYALLMVKDFLLFIHGKVALKQGH
jgi:PST family polysaccharide transporter